MMYYCDICAKVRNFPITVKTQKSHQCDFCDGNIVKCNTGTYSTLVGFGRNPDTFKTEMESIQVNQMLNIPTNLPVTKIHPKEKTFHLSDKCIVAFLATQGKNDSTTIMITNRETGEQISVQM